MKIFLTQTPFMRVHNHRRLENGSGTALTLVVQEAMDRSKFFD